FDGMSSFYSSGVIPYEGAQGNTFRVRLSKDIKPGKYTFFCAVHGPLQSTEVEVRGPGADVPSQAEITREARKEIGEVATSVDGGTYDGNGFWSSGLLSSDPYMEYTLRISKPGTYRYACLLHPPMVGTLVVTP